MSRRTDPPRVQLSSSSAFMPNPGTRRLRVARCLQLAIFAQPARDTREYASLHASITSATGVGSAWCSVDADDTIRLSVEGTTTTTAHSLLVSRLLRRFERIDNALSRWTTDHNEYNNDDGLSSRRRSAVLVSFDKDSIELAKAKAQLRARWDTTTPSAAGNNGVNRDLDARDGQRRQQSLLPLFEARAF